MTKKQILATFEVTRAIADAIRELKSVPSGHLYAQVMNHLSLEQYTKIIDLLKSNRLIEERNSELAWIQ
jgi:hypothetical protein